MFKHALSVAILAAVSSAAFATGDCPIAQPAPKEQWQTKEALEKKLTAQGWDIKRIKVDGACYEVYTKDKNGRKVETYFDPKSLEELKK